ncbi:hypothetical protein [Rheinheimera sp.]|uniref:hypothetical protein n=1 Tax=Rheinheimera sp. TaxID=1869214 RepID=UPI002FDD0C27
MNLLRYMASAFTLLVLTGCAAVQQDVKFQSAGLENKSIVIVKSELKPAETQYTGSVGLLDYGIISAANSGLDRHLKALTFSEFDRVYSTIESNLKKHNISISYAPNILDRKTVDKIKAPKNGKNVNDLAALTGNSSANYVLLILPGHFGTTRSYYGPVPTSEPTAVSGVQIQLIDAKTNELKWYRYISSSKTIPAPWDEANYPNLTSSLYNSVNELSKLIEAELSHTAATNNKVAANPN